MAPPKTFVADRGWKLVETHANSAISGTSFTSRPGIQQLLAHVKCEPSDVALCVTFACRAMSSTAQRSPRSSITTDTAILTVHAGQRMSHIELHMRSKVNHELAEQIRYRTRETSPGSDPKDGDLIYFAPWGDIGFDYDASGVGYADQTIHIGKFTASPTELEKLDERPVRVEIVN